METFVARQPILTKNEEIYAYELLYRSNNQNNECSEDGDKATLDVLLTSIQIGIHELSEGKLCFVNFTENLLKSEVPKYIKPNIIVIEILESVFLSSELIHICKKLKELGYKIALDDFVMTDHEQAMENIMRLVDIVKIDIQNTSRSEQLKLIHLLQKFNVKILAEKVESRTEYEQCLKDGYTYFQGYYFSKPTILSTKDLELNSSNLYAIISELSHGEPDVSKIAYYIERDVAISYKLLKLINSRLILSSNEIKSIPHAVMLLGLTELKKWLYLLFMRENLQGKRNHIPNQIIKMCLIRAKTCELIAMNTGKRQDSASYFLTGILSLIDTLFDSPLDRIIEKLPLDKIIIDTLLGAQTPFRDSLELVISMEKGEWTEMDKLANKININKDILSNIYLNGIKWTNDIYESSF
ncbi:EAL domain-containing protein [Evansella sp. AB-P1]|uniref:EAL and HDOD domain-containing protein n=1 Tax=Evansella sp. AB-P1 TaxID=3037653 RepID=UPI00241F59EE|nr:EAL domain-containing protein [Evansella sp. AB-P1]MDG5787472.1 EAL domain-containing protein [Evansella sp. AB-P1]